MSLAAAAPKLSQGSSTEIAMILARFAAKNSCRKEDRKLRQARARHPVVAQLHGLAAWIAHTCSHKLKTITEIPIVLQTMEAAAAAIRSVDTYPMTVRLAEARWFCCEARLMHACLGSLQGWADLVRAKTHSAASAPSAQLHILEHIWSIFASHDRDSEASQAATSLPSQLLGNGLPPPRSCAGGGRALHAHSQVSEAVAGHIDRSGGWEGDAADGQPRGV